MPDPLSDLQRLGQEFDADVEVTQEDREAAAAFATFTKARRDLEEAIMIGALDDNYIVQAFARHRIAAIAAARPMIETEAWQPIESAPKDGSPINLFDPEYCDEEMNPSLNGHWSDGADDDAGGFQAAIWNNSQDYSATVNVNPTHWRPHPEPPAIRALGEN